MTDVLSARVDGHESLDAERWEGHQRVHADLATSLAAYKADANEWRRTLSDLRAEFVTDAEWRAEQRAMDTRMTTTERALSALSARETAQRGLLADGRTLILLAISVAAFGLALWDR